MSKKVARIISKRKIIRTNWVEEENVQIVIYTIVLLTNYLKSKSIFFVAQTFADSRVCLNAKSTLKYIIHMQFRFLQK